MLQESHFMLDYNLTPQLLPLHVDSKGEKLSWIQVKQNALIHEQDT